MAYIVLGAGLFASALAWYFSGRLLEFAGTGLTPTGLHLVSLLILIAGATISVALFVMLRALYDARAEAIKLADQATAELREQLNFSHQLIEAIPNPVFFKDVQGRYLGCNRAYEEIIGRPRSEIVGKTVSEVIPADVANRHEEVDLELVNKPGTRDYESSLYYRRDGSVHEAIFNKATFFQADGSVGGIVGTVVDITERKSLERKLNQRNETLRSIIESAPAAIIARDRDSVIRIWNPTAERMFGWKEDEVVGTATSIVPTRLSEETMQLRKRAESGELFFLEETQRLHKDGTEIDVSMSIAPVNGPEGQPNGTMVVINDITRRKQAERALHESEAQLRLAMYAAQMATWYWDITTDVLNCSSGMSALFGLSQDGPAPRYQDLHKALHPDDLPLLNATLRHAVKAGTDFQIDFRVLWPDASVHWISNRGQVYRDIDDRAMRIIGVAMDISERKQVEERIAHMAHHDALTGLPNRALLRDRIGQAIARAHRNQAEVAVLFIDLDRFKHINDSLGHEAGDSLLEAVATRISVCLREGDTVSRLGGDEFVIVLPDADSRSAAAVAAKVLEALSMPFQLHEHDLHVTASIGISGYPGDGEDTDMLMRNADTAMYHAKDTGRANYQFFTARMNASTQQRFRLETDLRGALERREFTLFYQPVFTIVDRRPIGFEALLRWNHPDRGLVLPGEFIGHAETSGLIIPLGEWVLREACMQIKRWQDRGLALKVAVNISAHQLRRKGFHELLSSVVRGTGIDPALLELEITEGVLIEGVDEALKLLGLIDALGIRLAVDDFGTGYSGLSYLKRFPIDTVKIDQSFIRDLSVDPDDAAIVRAIVAMARSLKLSVVAEGVETGEQLAYLQTLDCDMAQGFYLGHPIPIDGLNHFVGERLRTTATL